MTPEAAGEIGLVGQIIDALAQPIMGYFSDTLETPFGKRIPVYLVSVILVVPCFYYILAPPEFAVGGSFTSPEPVNWYFYVLPSVMLIGQGGMQLTHLSIMNSLTYDQRRRDTLINYRNSIAYAAGVYVPMVSFFCFKYITTEFDQFFGLMFGCILIGVPASIFFLCQIREAKLVKASKEVYDKYFLLDDVGLPEEGQAVIFDKDLPQFGGEPSTPVSKPNKNLGKSQKLQKRVQPLDTDSSSEESSAASVGQMFDRARKRVEERGTVSAGGAHFIYAPARKDRNVTPTRYTGDRRMPTYNEYDADSNDFYDEINKRKVRGDIDEDPFDDSPRNRRGRSKSKKERRMKRVQIEEDPEQVAQRNKRENKKLRKK